MFVSVFVIIAAVMVCDKEVLIFQSYRTIQARICPRDSGTVDVSVLAYSLRNFVTTLASWLNDCYGIRRIIVVLVADSSCIHLKWNISILYLSPIVVCLDLNDFNNGAKKTSCTGKKKVLHIYKRDSVYVTVFSNQTAGEQECYAMSCMCVPAAALSYSARMLSQKLVNSSTYYSNIICCLPNLGTLF